MKSFKKNALIIAPIVLMLLFLPFTCYTNELNHSEWSDSNSSEEAFQLFEQGREAFEMGRTSDAVEYFDKALQKDAQYAIVWLYKAHAAETDIERKSNINKANRFRNNATKKEKMLIDIELTYADNNAEKRFQLAKQLAQLYPENNRALLALADEYQHRGETSKFRNLVYEAIRVEPDSPLGYRALAASWLLNEPIDYSLAEKYMQKYVELRPKEVSAYIALGDIYRGTLNLNMSRIAYTKATEIDPQNAIVLSKRGYIHTYMGMFKEARADYKKASALTSKIQGYLKPNFSLFSYLFPNNGKMTVDYSQWTSSSTNKTKRFSLEGDTDNSYFCCNFISMTHGFFASPDESLGVRRCLLHEFVMESRAPEKNTIEANIAFAKGYRAFQLKDYDKAKQIIVEYARTISPEMKPIKNEAHNFLAGLIYFGQEKYDKALASFKKSDTRNIFVKYNMGLAYHKLGRYEDAKIIFEEVADLKFDYSSNAIMLKTANGLLRSYDAESLAIK